MPKNSGKRRQRRRPESGSSSASASSGSQTPNPEELWDAFVEKYSDPDLWSRSDFTPWDTPEYEAVCRADREKAYRKNCERYGPYEPSFELNPNYSVEKLARPTGWETCPNPSPQDLEPLRNHPWPGYECPICGKSTHYELNCAYLESFPPDGRLLNHKAYEVVCQCGQAIVAGSCPSPYCLPGRPHRVVRKRKPPQSKYTVGINHPSFDMSDDMSMYMLTSREATMPVFGDLY